MSQEFERIWRFGREGEKGEDKIEKVGGRVILGAGRTVVGRARGEYTWPSTLDEKLDKPRFLSSLNFFGLVTYGRAWELPA